MNRRFFLFACAAIALLHLYIGVRLLPALPIGRDTAIAGALLLAASAVLLPMGMLARTLSNRTWADRLTWMGYMAMSVFSSLLLLTLLRDIVLAAGALFMAPDARALFSSDSAVAVSLLTAFATLVGLFGCLHGYLFRDSRSV